jgi:hypothetical protein
MLFVIPDFDANIRILNEADISDTKTKQLKVIFLSYMIKVYKKQAFISMSWSAACFAQS